MRILTRLTRIALLAAITILVAAVAPAQDKPADTVQISVGFTNSEYRDLFSTRNEQGLVARLNAKIAASERFRLGGVFQYDRNCLGCLDRQDTYSFGPEVDFNLIEHRVALFGHALFGFQDTPGPGREFARTYGGGVKVYLGNIFLIPGEINYRRTKFAPDPVPQYSASVGVRF